MDSPVMTEVMVCMIWLPVETAETSAAAPNWPTMSKSAAPYMACSNMANSTGRENFSSGPKIFPSVKSDCVRIVLASLPQNFHKKPDKTTGIPASCLIRQNASF